MLDEGPRLGHARAEEDSHAGLDLLQHLVGLDDPVFPEGWILGAVEQGGILLLIVPTFSVPSPRGGREQGKRVSSLFLKNIMRSYLCHVNPGNGEASSPKLQGENLQELLFAFSIH